MKRNYFTAILLSAFAATAMISCDKSDDVATGFSISGQIDSLQSGTADSIKIFGFHEGDNGDETTIELGKCKLDGDKFTVQLMTPPANILNHFHVTNETDTLGYNIYTYTTNVNLSDTTMSAFGALEFGAYKNGDYKGEIIKSNTIMSGEAGYKHSVFLYSDKYCKMEGTEIDKQEYNDGTKKYTRSYYEIKYNITIQPGWNEFVISFDKVVETDSTKYEQQTLSNTIPTDLKWKFIPRTNYYNSPQKRIGANQKVHHMGFIGRLLK